MSVPKLWTVAEANAILPRLSLLVGEQLVLVTDIERDLRQLNQMRRAHALTAEADGVESRDVEDLSSFEDALRARMARCDEYWRQIEALGVVLRDPTIGLCDFYGRVDGKLVWLCWRYGEKAVEHYHDLNAGFAGRKRLGVPARESVLN